MTVLDCVNAVKNGNFQEVPESKEERIMVLTNQLVANFSLILAHCLMNGIPKDENSDKVFMLRSQMFDDVMQTVNLRNFCRVTTVVRDLGTICSTYEDKSVMWPSKKERNNIILFITQYMMWDDDIRAQFFGAVPETEEPPAPAEEVVEYAEQVSEEM